MVIDLAEGASTQILLIANQLLGETLASELNSTEKDIEVILKPDKLTHHPSVVVWILEQLESPTAIQLELKQLQEYWKPAPLLLIIPNEISVKPSQLLQFDCPGLLQAPDLIKLREAITTLLGGGRVIQLLENSEMDAYSPQVAMGLGQWLLLSGIQQVENDLQLMGELIRKPPRSIILILMAKGRIRELNAAKDFLNFLWGPLRMEINSISRNTNQETVESTDKSTNITLKDRSSASVWKAINKRIKERVELGVSNSTGSILALDSLNKSRRIDLLLSILSQLDLVIQRLQNTIREGNAIEESWTSLQPEIRQQALRNMAGSYVRMQRNKVLIPVADFLISHSDLLQVDQELPDKDLMLDPLLLNKPVLVEGQLLPADDPRALITLERYVNNWLIRTAEIISSEILSSCGEWPEIRRYLLNHHLISTRELERFRNQLNTQVRWQSFLERPIHIYESKRMLYTFNSNYIQFIFITELRDNELSELGWWQQQVILLLEARDALTPQLQALIRRLGDITVILLTKVIGRAIGLVGRGIAQGMGRSMGRS